MTINLEKSEIETIIKALKDSGLEYTDNIILYEKFLDILDNVSVNDIKR